MNFSYSVFVCNEINNKVSYQRILEYINNYGKVFREIKTS